VASAGDVSVKNESRDERQAVKDAHALIVHKICTLSCKKIAFYSEKIFSQSKELGKKSGKVLFDW
jgi:hypothetical protein